MADGGALGIPGYDDPVEIGRGGFGVVYRARQPELDRAVAIKLLIGAQVDARTRERFDRERRVMGSLSAHPAIVTVHESGLTPGGQPYLVMELLEGGSLADRVGRDGPVPWPEAVTIGARLAQGVEAAHQAGVLHRDIKPENVLVSAYGEVKLTDFGIASLVEGTATATTSVTASIQHAAPEVLEGKGASTRSDVYSLGSTVYALLAGTPAFRRPTDDGVLPVITRVLSEPPPDLRPRGVPDAVCEVVERAMAKDPAERQAGAAAFGADLLAASAGAPTMQERSIVVAPGALAAGPPEPLGPPTGPAPVAARRSRRGLAVVGAAVVAALAVGAGAFALAGGGGGDDDADVVAGDLSGATGDAVSDDPDGVDGVDGSAGLGDAVATTTAAPGAGATTTTKPAPGAATTATTASPTTAVPGATTGPGDAVAASAPTTRPGGTRPPTTAPPATAAPTAAPPTAAPTTAPPTTAPPPATAAVPDVRGQTLDAASGALTGAGFGNQPYVYGCYGSTNRGRVVTQSPGPGTVQVLTAPVSMQLEGNDCRIVPSVIGQDLNSAASALNGAGLNNIPYVYECVGSPSIGAVVSQDPPAGRDIPQGNAVSLVLQANNC